MKTLINESVKVGVVFGNGHKIKPVWFHWQGSRRRISAVTYRWKSRRGSAVIHHFSVTDGADLYELRYDTQSCIWELAYVETEG